MIERIAETQCALFFCYIHGFHGVLPPLSAQPTSPLLGETNRARSLPPLQGEVAKSPILPEGCIVGAIINRPRQGSCNLPPGHCEELPKQRRGNPFPLCRRFRFSTAFAGLLGSKASLVQREVASARTTEGLMLCSWLSCAKSDCSMSQSPAVPSRKPHMKTNRWGTIPQSAKLTAPFTQRGLWCAATPRMLCKIAPFHEAAFSHEALPHEV